MRPVQLKRRGVAAVIAVVGLALSGSVAGLGSAVASVPREAESGASILAETDQAVYAEPSSTTTTLSRGTSKVTLSRSAALTREMLTVSWEGMTPSTLASGKVVYPVVVMQCRGTDPDRHDCWDYDNTLVRPTHYAPADTNQFLGKPGLVGPALRVPFRNPDGSYRAVKRSDWIVPGFRESVLPEVPPLDDWTPATTNHRVGTTGANGVGQLQTWVNTGFENPSLGCSEVSECSLVVVPVAPRPCLTTLPPAALNTCNRDSNVKMFMNFWQLLANWHERFVFKLSFTPKAPTCEQRDDSALLTGSEIVAEAMRRWVPVRCQQSSPVALDYTRKWEPESRTQQGHTDTLNPSGFAVDGVLTSEPAAADSATATKRKPGYAPIAISGLAIGYNWDITAGSDKGRPVPDVKLNARLVAKLLTQSYPGKYRIGSANNPPVNPNAATNPPTIQLDPEFQTLNPGANNWAGFSDGAGTQMAIPGADNDVMLALTRWIWSDPAARAFVQGKADPWGMVVNTSYRGWQLPTTAYSLKDGWIIPEGSLQGDWEGFAPQQLGAATPNSWAEGADSVMVAWPLSQAPTRPATPPNSPPQPKRNLEQVHPGRNLITLSTTSELEKVGMRTALLQNSAGEFVGPNVESMTYALDGATVDQASGTWKINYGAMDKRGYPGTMISYASVPTATLKKEVPQRYADTIRWLSTEGQTYGVEPGQLPNGYLALTEPMQEQAEKVAVAVEKQSGTPPIPPDGKDPLPDDKDPTPDDPDDPADNPGQQPGSNDGNGNGNNNNGDNNGNGNGTGNGNTGDNTGNGNGTGNGDGDGNGNGNGTGTNKPGSTPTTPGATPSGNPSKAPAQAAGTKPVSATTKGESLGWLSWGIPALLVAGLAAGVASPGIRIIAQPGHPVRRGIVAGGTYVGSLLRRGRRRNN